jgi:hypothetical protein
MVDLNAVNVAVENKSQQRSQFWVDRIKTTLNSRENTMGDPMRSYTELSVSSFVFFVLCMLMIYHLIYLSCSMFTNNILPLSLSHGMFYSSLDV